MRQGLLQIGLILAGMGMLGNVYAQDHNRDPHLPAFKLQKNENFLNPQLSSTLEAETSVSNVATGPEARLRSYDAIFYYPLHRRGVSFDLGVNIRLQEDLNKSGLQGGVQQDWLSIDPAETQTRVHAAAVFDLPFSGLQAGVSGSYDPSIESIDYDYQAKLTYKWKNGFGLQGGWQHQQKPLEQQNLNETLDVQTLFLDLNYRF